MQYIDHLFKIISSSTILTILAWAIISLVLVWVYGKFEHEFQKKHNLTLQQIIQTMLYCTMFNGLPFCGIFNLLYEGEVNSLPTLIWMVFLLCWLWCGSTILAKYLSSPK